MTDLDTLTDAWDRLVPGPAPVDAILRAHHAQQRVRRRRVLAAVGAVAAVAVVAASLAVQAQRTTPAPEPGHPATSAPTPTPTPSPTTASSTLAPDPTATVFVLVNGSGLRFVGLMPRSVPLTAAGEPAEAALRTLLAHAPRRRSVIGPENAWLGPGGRPLARLRSVDRGDGQVVVDLAAADPSLDWDPDYAEVLPLLQVACTAQAALRTTDPVRITLRGEPVRLFGRDASRPRSCDPRLLPDDASGAPTP